MGKSLPCFTEVALGKKKVVSTDPFFVTIHLKKFRDEDIFRLTCADCLGISSQEECKMGEMKSTRYPISSRLHRYFIGFIHPRAFLMRASLYQKMYSFVRVQPKKPFGDEDIFCTRLLRLFGHSNQ